MVSAPVDSDIEFSIAVLCYRAEEDIIPFVEDLHKMFSMFRFTWEIVLVANYWPGMPDRTPDIARDIAKRLPNIRVLALPKEGAMGWDFRAGLAACRGKYIGLIDGDGQYPMEAIFSCFAKIKKDDCDFVKTYRVVRQDGPYRMLISSGYNALFKLLFPDYRGLNDVNSKPKIMKRELYRRMTLHSNDWFIDAEIVLNCLAMKIPIAEIPIRFMKQGHRNSFVKPAAVVEFLKHLIQYRFSSGSWRPKAA